MIEESVFCLALLSNVIISIVVFFRDCSFLKLERLNKIIDEERVKEVIIFTSCDAYGKQAEYVRDGLDFDVLFKNIDKIFDKIFV